MKIYIYPTYTPSRDKSGNLYIKYFHDSFKNIPSIKRLNHFWKIGICSVLFNLSSDLFIIQWIDLIPLKRYGKVQFCIFLFSIKLLSILKKKIIWVLHNKHAHNSNSKLVDIGMSFMAKYSTAVVVHAKEGISFFDKMFPCYKGKCHYIPHPVYMTKIYESDKIEWDFIIWGNISRRKNILDFIKFTRHNSFFKDKKILICGKCNDLSYDSLIRKILVSNITYINSFISDEKLIDYIKKSRCILFTYKTSSLLCSGALIYSLNFNKPIIGPNVGNFLDFKGIVQCYNSFADIPQLVLKNSPEIICQYIKSNTWDKFPQKIMAIFESSVNGL